MCLRSVYSETFDDITAGRRPRLFLPPEIRFFCALESVAHEFPDRIEHDLVAGAPHVLPADQRAEEAYSAVYTGPVLTEPLEILGRPRLILGSTATPR